MATFDISVNVAEIAEKLGQTVESMVDRVNLEVHRLSIGTHAFVVKYAQDRLKGWKRDHFFGENNKNVRWVQMAENMWVVEVDESVGWLEEGREKKFMEWLLNSKNAKTAKDGSRYAVIPFTQARKRGGDFKNPYPEFTSIVNQVLKSQKISLSKIEKMPDGAPKLGVLHKLNIAPPKSSDPGFFTMVAPRKFDFTSKPRTADQARELGLRPYSGKFLLSNAVVTQREIVSPTGKKRVKREVVTFRVISSKHKGEGRWYYPRVEPLNSIPAAYDWAMKEWQSIVKGMEAEFNKTTGA